MSATTHNDVVRREFTGQAASFAASPLIADADRVARLVRAVAPDASARVLEVATGPGYVAMGFAAVCREVVGLDLTDAMLAIAERTRRERGLRNLRFQSGDAAALPFADGEFDVVMCRYAFHHFEQPARVLAEMARCWRRGGTVAMEDAVTSEHPERAAYQNRFENLRDPSHTRAYPLSGLLTLFAAAGLEVERVTTDRLELPVERWLQGASTPPEAAAETRALIERDEREDLSGTRPFRRDGKLYFNSRTATLVGRKLTQRCGPRGGAP